MHCWLTLTPRINFYSFSNQWDKFTCPFKLAHLFSAVSDLNRAIFSTLLWPQCIGTLYSGMESRLTAHKFLTDFGGCHLSTRSKIWMAVREKKEGKMWVGRKVMEREAICWIQTNLDSLWITSRPSDTGPVNLIVSSSLTFHFSPSRWYPWPSPISFLCFTFIYLCLCWQFKVFQPYIHD